MELAKVRRIYGNGCLSFKYIYFKSKRCDDYIYLSTGLTLILSYRFVGKKI